MKNENNINNVLDFYVMGNKLKTMIIDEVNDYSVADNLFDSMMLAVAFDSEFKECENIGKLLQLMVLDVIQRLYPDYNVFDSLTEKWNISVRSKDDALNYERLIFKYRSLDFALTDFIVNKSNSLNVDDIQKELMRIFKPRNFEEYNKYKEIFRFYKKTFNLKNKIRSGWDSKHWNVKALRVESVSEHVVGTIALAMAMKYEFGYNINIDEVVKTLAIHEIGEAIIGDITPFDGVTAEDKKEIEHRAMREVLGNLSDNDLLINMLFNFDCRLTNEDVFAYFCDKLEADFQSKIYQDKGFHHSLDDQASNCVFASPKAQQILNNGAKTAFDVWYFYDLPIYENNQDFPEFSDLLNYIKENDLVKKEDEQVKKRMLFHK